MSYIQIFYCLNSSKSGNLSIYCVKCTCCFKLALPGIFIIASHIVVCMITGNNHQRTENNFLESGIFNLLNNCLAFCIFRFTFYSSNESVGKSKVFHLCLHLIICNIRCMRSSMSHKYKCCSVICCSSHIIISGFTCCICNSLCNSFLVIVDHSCIITNFAKHWLCDCYRFEFIFVTINSFYHFIIFSTVHQMCRLNNQILNTVVYCTLKCLIHIVDIFLISCFYMINNDLSCKCSSY